MDELITQNDMLYLITKTEDKQLMLQTKRRMLSGDWNALQPSMFQIIEGVIKHENPTPFSQVQQIKRQMSTLYHETRNVCYKHMILQSEMMAFKSRLNWINRLLGKLFLRWKAKIVLCETEITWRQLLMQEYESVITDYKRQLRIYHNEYDKISKEIDSNITEHDLDRESWIMRTKINKKGGV